MKRKNLLCFLWTLFVLRSNDFVVAEADPTILPGAEFGHLQQNPSPLDSRPRLSASQQVQILSDVQQHQQRFHRPGQESSQSSTPYASLAKYKIDRTKQQQIQQLLQQQQQVQQLIQQQQQKIAQQLNSNGFNGPQGQYYQQANKQQQFQQQYNNQYQNLPNNIQNLQQDLSQPLFSEQHTIQLQTYLEKQRELEELQKQRQQLILEQQELKRRQELLKLQQLRQLTSTTSSPSPPPPSSSSQPSTTAIPFVSTTNAPIVLTSQAARKITTSETELFLKAIASHQKKYSTTTSIPATVRPLVTIKQQHHENIQEETSTIPENLSSLIEEHRRQAIQQGKPRPEIKIIYQTEAPARQTTVKSKLAESSDALERELLLKQLKSALSETAENDDIRNVTTRDLVLPNGKKLQVIHAPNGLSSIVPTDSSTSLRTSTQILSSTTTTIKPPKVIFEELTKGVLPPGADFKIIRQKSDGKLEEIGKAPIQNLPAKKVTFVVLEEQPDGSYKVQGVKGNTDKEGTDVESIVEKIKKGELKLPPSSSNPTKATFEEEANEEITDFSSTKISSPSSRTVSIVPTTSKSTTARYTTPSSRLIGSKATSEYYPYVTVSSNSASTGDNYVTSASSLSSHVYNTVGSTDINLKSKSQNVPATTRASIGTKSHFVPTMAPVNEIITTYSPPISTTFSSSPSFSSHFTPRQPSETSPTPRSIISTTRSPVTHNKNPIYQDDTERTTIPSIESHVNKNQVHESLTTLLRKEGLFAIAKYLRQSGLDTVLNETGPYTIFVPTDKAFRTLLVQLGGPEKAEQKFRDNPRLLSGLLLHHVIPGAFRIDSLQDEMTGVSLAGTQLRVNEYAMHDHEWNDVKQVTTINGAKVAPNKRDIEIPQGIAHAIDRVMFPLPVGDLVQTLQADRERRFTTFLKMLYTSGLDTTLAGPKTFTVFAPTDSAFTSAASKNGTPIWTEEDGPVAAKAVVSRHIIPTTLYTAGMRYYLQKDTLRVQSPVHIHKNGGRVRVNEVNVVTHNVPATNGVLHAIDGVL
ncbi:mucin-5AC isoform X1 [Vespula pensylvanica]|uniref:mucin-5AC isoform X1 n=1 Tax=Vespula pensylvanica TaxID=30213 RepID=UPI001CB9F6AA|nr:mucin-5AC isoform X1 [Vespula pensylvanica]